jgi:hypothetical protein
MNSLCLKLVRPKIDGEYRGNLKLEPSIRESTSIIIIYSKICNIVSIYINGVDFPIKRGLNKICICNLQSKSLNEFLNIKVNKSEKLTIVNTKNEGVDILVLKSTNKNSKYFNDEVPTLLESAFFSLLMAGISNIKLYNLVKRGFIPAKIYEKRIPTYSLLGFFDVGEILCLDFRRTYKTQSCKNPIKHLQINPLNYLQYT